MLARGKIDMVAIPAWATVLGIINTVVSMIACPIIASYKGRSVAGWFFGGLFLGLIGLIIISCLKPIDR